MVMGKDNYTKVHMNTLSAIKAVNALKTFSYQLFLSLHSPSPKLEVEECLKPSNFLLRASVAGESGPVVIIDGSLVATL